MPAKKTPVAAVTSAVTESSPTPRELRDVVAQIQRLRGEGMTVPEICEELMTTYHVVNQVITQSYKMSMDTIAVFERQEKQRLGIE